MTTDIPAVLAKAASNKARSIEHRRWFRLAARLGLAARGVIYLLLAYFAMDIAIHGSSPAQPNGTGALTEIAHQPAAPLLLVILGAGLLSYALWRIVLAVGGPSDSKAESAAKRIGWLAIAVIYLVLFAQTISLVVGSGASNGGPTTRPSPFVARALRWPGGPELVGLVGVAIICGGVGLAAWACLHDFDKTFEIGRMSRGARLGARISQIFGDITRGVLVVLIGVYLLVGAITDDPVHAKSLGQVLETIVHQSYGIWMIGVAALGLLAFCVSSMFESIYRRV